MHTPSLVEEHAAALLTSAQAFQLASTRPGSSEAAPVLLAGLEESMRLLAAGWEQLAADAAATGSSDHLPPAQRRLVGVLQDVGAAFVRCSRVCRDAEDVMAHLRPPTTADADGSGAVLTPAERS